METIEKRVHKCPQCGKSSRFYQKRESINWLLHLIMMIITGGLWIPVFFLIVSFNLLKIGFIRGEWSCANCGYIDRDALKERQKVLKAVSLAWLAFYSVGFVDWMLHLSS
jgi:ribosomal protein L37AE/L43A